MSASWGPMWGRHISVVPESAAVALWIHRRPSRNGIFLRARQQKSGKWGERKTRVSLFGIWMQGWFGQSGPIGFYTIKRNIRYAI